MTEKNYTRTISVNASPRAIYQALTEGFEQWWTSADGNGFKQTGDRIKFTFPPLVSHWTLEAKVLEANERVELECVEAYHDFNDHEDTPKQEWLGTNLIWTIISYDDHTDLQFTHDGLTPDLHCFDVCEAGWDMFFVSSLKAYLDTGIGTPFNESMVNE